MIEPEQQKHPGPGRPIGSRKQGRRELRSYRFTPETLRILGEQAGDDKTAFVERAIADYASRQTRQDEQAEQRAQILTLNAQRDVLTSVYVEHIAAQERTVSEVEAQAQAQAVTYQARIDDLLAQLAQTQQQTRAYEAELRDLYARLEAQGRQAPTHPAKKAPAQTSTPAPTKRPNPARAYQIILRHQPGQPCPQLPAGFAYDESDKTVGLKGALDAHSTHTVLDEEWPIAKVRRELEKLKAIPGITSLWIARFGLAVRKPTGQPTDMWRRDQQGVWQRDY
jgi:chromosome segregation ATPase